MDKIDQDCSDLRSPGIPSLGELSHLVQNSKTFVVLAHQ